jgi:tetratricopeptide (TPR) repeat protein
MRIALLLLLMCSSLMAFAAPEDDAKKQMEKGGKAFSAGKYSDAVLAFSRALEILPEAAGPHRELGKCYQKLNEPERALNHYTQYLTKRPDAEERKTIEALMIEIRDKLPTQGRALISIDAFPGAVVYVISQSGETQGIGVSPVLRHPVEARFTTLRIITQDKLIKEKTLQLIPSNELLLGDADFGINPPKKPEETTPVITPSLELPKTAPGEQKPTEKSTDAATPSKAPKLLFVGAGALALAGGASGALFFLTTNQMQSKIDSLNTASIDEEATIREELTTLEKRALTTMRIAQVTGAAAIVTAGAAIALSVKSNKEKTSLVLSPNHVALSIALP